MGGGLKSDVAALDRAYASGRMIGLFGLGTISDCPFRYGPPDLRIAWLDGFAYGSWLAAAALDDRRSA